MLTRKNIVHEAKICYYMSAHAFYSKKPPVLQKLGGFLSIRKCEFILVIFPWKVFLVK